MINNSNIQPSAELLLLFYYDNYIRNNSKMEINMIKKVLLLFTIIILLTGCAKASESSKIEPVSVGGYDYNNVSEILDKYNTKTDSVSEATLEPTETPATSIPYNCKEIEYKTFLAINKIRTENHLNELTWDENLYSSISIRSKEISEKFSHTRPNGSSCFTISKQLHGENIAKGYTSVDRVVEGWMNSPGHKENILRKDFKRTAIGYYKSSSGTYWCQGFGY